MENLGLTHKDRYSEKLEASYFNIDERTLEDFVKFSKSFAEYINFYNTENNVDGSAIAFFGADVTMLLIHISSYKINNLENRFDEVIGLIEKNDAEYNFAMDLIFNLIEQVANWKDFTIDIKEFNNEINELIKSKYSKSLARLYEFEKCLITKTNYESVNKQYRFLSEPEWSIDGYEIEPFVFKSTEKEALKKEIINYLYTLFNSIVATTILLIESSKKYLQNITDNGMTQPHVALYIAFIEMYKHAQNDINKFTQRHLDYYYKEILKLDNIPETPDKVHLVFDLQDNVDSYRLKEGTGFYAGQDKNGKELQYKLDHEIVISQAKINNLKTIINYDELSNEKHDFFEHVFLSSDVNNDVHEEEKDDKSYNLGFAIASSFLKLPEGYREIKFTFYLQRYAFEDFIKLFNNQILKNPNVNIDDIDEFVNDLFSFAYSSLNEQDEQEMFVIPQKNVNTYFKKNSEGIPLNQFYVEVKIPEVFPPIAPYLSDDFPEAKERELPLCYFFLSRDNVGYYNYYKKLVVDKVGLNIHVEGVRDLIVQNQYGLVDGTVPFEPFGATPSIGSTFYLGHETIFSKKIDELQIVMDWKDVPLDENGFAEYYQGYSDINNNQVFKASVSALKDRKWIPEDNKQVVHLFDDVDELEDANIMPVNNIRVIDDLDLNKINDVFKGAAKINENDAYSRISTNGFLKFEFVYPPNGFGHNEYPKILKRQASKAIKKGASAMEELNEPWSPTLNSISINYEASTLIDFSHQGRYKRPCYYHLKPFGNELASEPAGNRITIIPDYDEGAEVYIAIENFSPEEDLSIFININNLIKSTKDKVDVKWSFLQNDKWIDIYDKAILNDTTNDLSSSGIITFDFSEYNTDFFNLKSLTFNDTFPKGFFYLRIKTNSGDSFINRINYIRCHGAVASFFNNNNVAEHLTEGLPSGTIVSFTDDHPDIREVIQPFPSFGGSGKENRTDFQIRVSERLRHKNRGVTKWDYEHIILQEFSKITKVICLNNTNNQVKKEPGNVLLVVIPEIQTFTGNSKNLEPRSSDVELKEIRDYVKDRISPFINLSVRNPIYEQVQVKFEVKFNEGYNPRYYMQVVNQDLAVFLNPWVKKDSGVQITATDNVYSMHIVYFLEKRPYIDFVSNVSVFHIVDGAIINLESSHSNNVVLKPTTAISILVSAPEHIIGMIGTDSVQDAIGTLIVEKNFSAKYTAPPKITKGIEKDEIEVDFEIEMKNKVVKKEGDDYTLTIDI